MLNYSLLYCLFFFFNDTATTEIYTTANTLSLHDALPIPGTHTSTPRGTSPTTTTWPRSEEHTSELQSLAVISYAVFCLKKKNITKPLSHSLFYHNRTNTIKDNNNT